MLLKKLSLILGWFLAFICCLWAFGALYFDFPIASGGFAWAFVILTPAATWLLRRRCWPPLVPLAAAAIVLAWWSQLQPSHDRSWQTNVSRLPWAVIEGDRVTLHNVRNFDYPPDGEPVARWETREFDLNEITGMDIAINYWGSPWIAHPIMTFHFANTAPVAFSIETRKEEGESFSALGGFFRRFELIILAGDERDFFRLRIGNDEDIFLYQTNFSPQRARTRFVEYLTAINQLQRQPRWYHAITTNCTTAIRTLAASDRIPWDWRLLINGLADQMLYEHGILTTGGLSFAELRQSALINQAVREAHDDLEFSHRIREAHPGFTTPSDWN